MSSLCLSVVYSSYTDTGCWTISVCCSTTYPLAVVWKMHFSNDSNRYLIKPLMVERLLWHNTSALDMLNIFHIWQVWRLLSNGLNSFNIKYTHTNTKDWQSDTHDNDEHFYKIRLIKIDKFWWTKKRVESIEIVTVPFSH